MPRGTFQEDPSLWWAPASPRLCRRPQTWQGAVVQSPMRLLLLSSGSWCIHNFVCALQEWSLCFTHSSGRPIIKSHWPWRPDFLVIPSLFVRSPNWEAWLGPCEDSEPSQWCKDFFSFIVLQSVGHPPGSYGIWFDRDCTTDTMSYLTLRFPLCLWTWGIFFCGFQCPPVDGCSTVSCNSGALADRDEHRCFYSAILNWNLRTISLIIWTLVGKVMFLLFNMSSRFVIAFFLRRKAKVKVTQLCLILCNPGQNSPGQNTRVGSRSLLQGIFPTQGLNPGLPYCRQILYQMSQQGRKCLWISWLFSLSCDFGAPQNEICHCFHCFPTYFPWSDGTGCHDLSFFNVDF